ncbi:MAG: hypothetical protein JWQ35_126 [Bacteriovoracaceae bacterium]|nr:hypothetical protein [Bacteriovoracaceae bacterium]
MNALIFLRGIVLFIFSFVAMVPVISASTGSFRPDCGHYFRLILMNKLFNAKQIPHAETDGERFSSDHFKHHKKALPRHFVSLDPSFDRHFITPREIPRLNELFAMMESVNSRLKYSLLSPEVLKLQFVNKPELFASSHHIFGHVSIPISHLHQLPSTSAVLTHELAHLTYSKNMESFVSNLGAPYLWNLIPNLYSDSDQKLFVERDEKLVQKRNLLWRWAQNGALLDEEELEYKTLVREIQEIEVTIEQKPEFKTQSTIMELSWPYQEVFADIYTYIHERNPKALSNLFDTTNLEKYIRNPLFECFGLFTKNTSLMKSIYSDSHIELFSTRNFLWRIFYLDQNLQPGNNENYDSLVLRITFESMADLSLPNIVSAYKGEEPTKLSGSDDALIEQYKIESTIENRIGVYIHELNESLRSSNKEFHTKLKWEDSMKKIQAYYEKIRNQLDQEKTIPNT